MQTEIQSKDYMFTLELATQVLEGIVFKQKKDINQLDSSLLKFISNGVYLQTQEACSLLVKQSPRLMNNLIRKVVPKSAAFISIVAYELIERKAGSINLIDAATIMGLSQIVDHLMDRGDEKMLIALDYYLSGTVTNDPELLARIQPIKYSTMLSKRVAMQDATLVSEASLDVLRDEAAVLRSSNEYKELDNTFRKDVYFRRNAETLADLSIRNVGLRPATYLVYLSYVHADYNILPIRDIIEQPDIMRLVRLGEWAIRLWDDWGDREIDAGKDIYTNAFAINIFLERNPYLTEAYLRDIANTPYHQLAWNIIQEGNEGINYIIIGILREEFRALKQSIDEEYCLFLTLLERIIEAGFINVAGDEAISAVKEVVPDYAKSD